ncbi:MAG: hypothetical protein LBV34_25890 [Nocardiopsaceae bacterium]|jgi:hypothetical protein|nr:hypothetical protein [Nocardiopsaceae bacterium]
MSLIRLLPAGFHAVADYAVAALLIVVPILVGGSTLAVATGVTVGIVVALVSALTRYPLGVVKVLPFTVHSLGDYLAVILLAAAPFALGYTATDHSLSLFYEGAAAAVLLVSLITNYQYSPKKAESAASQHAAPPQQGVPLQQGVQFQQGVPTQQMAAAYPTVPAPPTVPVYQAASPNGIAAAQANNGRDAAPDQLAAQVQEAAWAEQDRLAQESARAEKDRLAREAAWAEQERLARKAAWDEQERLAREAEAKIQARKAAWAERAALDEQVAKARQAYKAALAQQAAAHQAPAAQQAAPSSDAEARAHQRSNGRRRPRQGCSPRGRRPTRA